MRLASDILKLAFQHGNRKVPVTAEEFERVLTFHKAYVGVEAVNNSLTLRNGSRIYIQGA